MCIRVCVSPLSPMCGIGQLGKATFMGMVSSNRGEMSIACQHLTIFICKAVVCNGGVCCRGICVFGDESCDSAKLLTRRSVSQRG